MAIPFRGPLTRNSIAPLQVKSPGRHFAMALRARKYNLIQSQMASIMANKASGKLGPEIQCGQGVNVHDVCLLHKLNIYVLPAIITLSTQKRVQISIQNHSYGASTIKPTV